MVAETGGVHSFNHQYVDDIGAGITERGFDVQSRIGAMGLFLRMLLI